MDTTCSFKIVRHATISPLPDHAATYLRRPPQTIHERPRVSSTQASRINFPFQIHLCTIQWRVGKLSFDFVALSSYATSDRSEGTIDLPLNRRQRSSSSVSSTCVPGPTVDNSNNSNDATLYVHERMSTGAYYGRSNHDKRLTYRPSKKLIEPAGGDLKQS